MPSTNQKLGDKGEKLVCSKVHCPKCKWDTKTLRQLKQNFKCADVICDFCGYLAQVKTFDMTTKDALPLQIPGAAWGPLKERLDAGIYYPLFIVGITSGRRSNAIWYLPADLQSKEMFVPRKPLSSKAKRKGWQGVTIHFGKATTPPIRLK